MNKDIIARKNIEKAYNKILNINNSNPKIFSNHLKNPFTRTNVKLIGDSITAGQGSTGFSTSGGEPIGSTIYFANNNTSPCWANLLRDHLTANYNVETMVEIKHSKLKWGIPVTFIRDLNTVAHWKVTLTNAIGTSRTILSWKFHGTSFSIDHVKGNSYGILDVYVDGVKIGELNAYSASFGYSQNTVFSGLTSDFHNVELRETGRKHASSTGYTLQIEAIRVSKTATVKNWGVPGVNTQWAYENRTSIITSTDDFVFIQLGTNERTFSRTIKCRTYLRELVQHCKSVGAVPILMSAPAAAIASETGTQKMDDIDSAIRNIAAELNVAFISNYTAFLRHSINTGVTIDSLLGDGLHPNDAGYKFHYENIAMETGLSLLRDGLTY